MNDDKSADDHHDTAFIDSTVQEKSVTYPTDSKLHRKIVGKVLKIVKEMNLPLRQSYRFVLKEIYRDQRFRNHPKNRKKALKADKRLRTIAGRLVRELKRNLGENPKYDELLSLFEQILLHRRNSSHKIYSIHERDVQCISKGKEHKLFCKRASIEPTIGHLKSDYRLGRNFYKGVVGDAINVMLAAAAYNFKRAMRLLLCLIQNLRLHIEIPKIRLTAYHSVIEF